MKPKLNKYKHLFKNYFVDQDKYNFILLRSRLTKKGKEDYDTLGYYSTIPQLRRGIMKHYAFENVLSEKVEDLIRDLERISDIIYD